MARVAAFSGSLSCHWQKARNVSSLHKLTGYFILTSNESGHDCRNNKFKRIWSYINYAWCGTSYTSCPILIHTSYSGGICPTWLLVFQIFGNVSVSNLGFMLIHITVHKHKNIITIFTFISVIVSASFHLFRNLCRSFQLRYCPSNAVIYNIPDMGQLIYYVN